MKDATLSNTMAETRNLHVATGGAIMRAVDQKSWREIQHTVWLGVIFEVGRSVDHITRAIHEANSDSLI